MKVVFLGVGEAGDEQYPNNSSLILSTTNLLLDCGFAVPQQLWKYNPNQEFIDAVYISHPHADHYFGVPGLLIRMLEEKRIKPITFICQKGMANRLLHLMELGYKDCQKIFPFQVNYLEVENGQTIQFNEFSLSFAPTVHPVSNLAIKVKLNNRSVCYSGDGMFTKETEALYHASDLVIHEAFALHGPIAGHATIDALLDMVQRNDVTSLALTHLQRQVRRKELDKVMELISQSETNIFLPEPLDTFEV